MFFAAPVLLAWLQSISPLAPQPATGQVAPLSNHGPHFYVLRWQAMLFNVLAWGGVGIFVLSAAVSRMLGIRPTDVKRLMPWVLLVYVPVFGMFALGMLASMSPQTFFPPRAG